MRRGRVAAHVCVTWCLGPTLCRWCALVTRARPSGVQNKNRLASSLGHVARRAVCCCTLSPTGVPPRCAAAPHAARKQVAGAKQSAGRSPRRRQRQRQHGVSCNGCPSRLAGLLQAAGGAVCCRPGRSGARPPCPWGTKGVPPSGPVFEPQPFRHVPRRVCVRIRRGAWGVCACVGVVCGCEPSVGVSLLAQLGSTLFSWAGLRSGPPLGGAEGVCVQV